MPFSIQHHSVDPLVGERFRIGEGTIKCDAIRNREGKKRKREREKLVMTVVCDPLGVEAG